MLANDNLSSSPSPPKTKKPFKFLLHCFYATGHVLPMQAVAKALIDRGHEIIWLASPSQESRVKASGARFVATEAIHRHDEVFQASEPKTLEEIVEVFVDGRVSSQVEDFRRVLKGEEVVDLVLMDALPWGLATLFETKEIKFWATLGVVPMFATEPAPKSTLGQLLKNAQLWVSSINKQREQLGLGPIEPSEVAHYSPLLHIQASCPSLEYHQTVHPTHYVGPLISPLNKSLAGGSPSWWKEVANSDKKVIGITQGTFAMDPTSLIIPAILALKDDPSLLLVASSPHVDKVKQRLAEIIGDDNLPVNLRLGSWVPYDALLALPQTQILITNGGYGSVTQALAYGVPLICAGTTEDKKDTAARMTSVGAGIDLQTDCPSVEQVRDAVGEILREGSTYKENLSKVSKELNALGGAERVCELLEEAASRSRAM